MLASGTAVRRDHAVEQLRRSAAAADTVSKTSKPAASDMVIVNGSSALGNAILQTKASLPPSVLGHINNTLPATEKMNSPHLTVPSAPTAQVESGTNAATLSNNNRGSSAPVVGPPFQSGLAEGRQTSATVSEPTMVLVHNAPGLNDQNQHQGDPMRPPPSEATKAHSPQHSQLA